MRSEQILRKQAFYWFARAIIIFPTVFMTVLSEAKRAARLICAEFLWGAGSVNDPSNSYHLEFVCASRTLANGFEENDQLFCGFIGESRRPQRTLFIVYMKNSEYISDTLAIMGASSQVFAFEDVRIKKGLVNDAVRITNCDNANTDRALDAAGKADCGDSENRSGKRS